MRSRFPHDVYVKRDLYRTKRTSKRGRHKTKKDLKKRCVDKNRDNCHRKVDLLTTYMSNETYIRQKRHTKEHFKKHSKRDLYTSKETSKRDLLTKETTFRNMVAGV